MAMHPHTRSQPLIANRPFRWMLIGALVLAPLAACVAADGALAPPDCEEPPLIPVDTSLPDSLRPDPEPNPQPDTPICDPDNV